MLNFSIALTMFLASHMILSRSRIKPLVISHFGMRAYLAAYCAVSVILLVWLIDAGVTAPRQQLWPWSHTLYWIPALVMPLACILMVAGFIVDNPLSLITRTGNFKSDRPGFIVAITRHPVLWGFALWSGSHLIVNGEFPLALMFGIFLIFAVLGTRMVDRQRQRVLGMQQWHQLAHHTCNLPFSASTLWSGRCGLTRRDIVGSAAGIVTYVIFFKAHAPLFGIMPVPPL